MPVYGAFNRGVTRPGYAGANPAAGKQWDYLERELIRDDPNAYNSWYMAQFPAQGQGSIDPRYRGFLELWLPEQQRAFAGHQLLNPEAQYQDFVAGKNPWDAYEMSGQAYRGWGRAQAPRMLRRT